jgi:hypothetical protein
MSSLSALHNRKNTSILTRADYLRISGNALPVEVDHTGEMERSRQAALHEKTLEVTQTWANSIANERKARITRLQKEAEQREAEQQAQDHLEHEHQKAKRREHLDRAERQAFEDKPEIRSVHAQLLLHEVARERQRQLLLKEQKQEVEARRESEYAAEERRKYEAAMEHERQIAQERRQRAAEVAADLRTQKKDAEERRAAQKLEEREEEAMLGAEARRLLDEEQLAETQKRERGALKRREITTSNDQLVGWRERQAELEAIEDERIRTQKCALDDAMEQRAAADAERRRTRQAGIDRMIARQRQMLSDINAQRREFDSQQTDLQYEKEKREIEEIRARQERLTRERREDFVEAQAKMEAKRRRRKEKGIFPPDETAQKMENVQWERQCERAKAQRDLAEFQRKQAAEKKEREAADRERRRLEFQRQIEEEEQRVHEAQDYAKEMLLKARSQRYATRRRFG